MEYRDIQSYLWRKKLQKSNRLMFIVNFPTKQQKDYSCFKSDRNCTMYNFRVYIPLVRQFPSIKPMFLGKKKSVKFVTGIDFCSDQQRFIPVAWLLSHLLYPSGFCQNQVVLTPQEILINRWWKKNGFSIYILKHFIVCCDFWFCI